MNKFFTKKFYQKLYIGSLSIGAGIFASVVVHKARQVPKTNLVEVKEEKMDPPIVEIASPPKSEAQLIEEDILRNFQEALPRLDFLGLSSEKEEVKPEDVVLLIPFQILNEVVSFRDFVAHSQEQFAHKKVFLKVIQSPEDLRSIQERTKRRVFDDNDDLILASFFDEEIN